MFPQALCHQSHVLTGVKNISHYLKMFQRRGSVAHCNIIKELFSSKRTLTAAVTLSPKGINSPTQAGVMSGGILSQERIRNMHLCSLWKNLPACAGASECLMLDVWDVHVTKCRADFSLCCSAGSIIMYGALLLFESEFVHIVAISFTSLILTELLMVALTIQTWHWLMIVGELLSLACYVASLVFLHEFIGEQTEGEGGVAVNSRPSRLTHTFRPDTVR